jgi:hypothetical protein
VNFAEQPPSKQWAALKYRGEKLAEVWFKPEGEPLGLMFRIPRTTFQIPGVGPQLTIGNLLRALGITPEEVESWRQGEVFDPDIRNPLPQPAEDVPHLEVHVRLRPLRPVTTDVPNEMSDPPELSVNWQDLDARWKAILGLEASVDTLRISMESLRAEMEGSLKKALTTEDKLYALRADVVQWNKAKSRVHHALPKVKEFIHRATWALGAPDRKELGELYKNHIQPQIPFPRMDKVLEQLEYLQKDRQVLTSLGNAVYHESKSIAAAVQGALKILQANAAAKAKQKKNEGNSKGKFFKDVRRWTGAE